MDDIIDEILDVIEDSIEYEDFCTHSDNCEVYAYIGGRKWLKKKIISMLLEVDTKEELNDILDKIMVEEL